jgi:hypothetical protein
MDNGRGTIAALSTTGDNHKPLKSARARYIKTAAKKQWQTVRNKNTKTATALRHIVKGRHTKMGPSLYNEIANRSGETIMALLRRYTAD